MKTIKLLLIGAGQLGSRHLQGLAKSSIPINISLVEPNSNNLKTALVRFHEIDISSDVKITDMVSSVGIINPQNFDMVIIATNADIRAEVTREILKKHKVSNIIFEKVAFQSEKQFEEIINLLKEKGIKSWVNCPRRFFPFYLSLRDKIKGTESLKLTVLGVDWGLACNAVHQIDLLSFLSGELFFLPSSAALDSKIYESRRSGFVEFFGSISGQSESGHSFSLTCNKRKSERENSWLTIKIESAKETIHIDEGLGIAEFYKTGEDVSYKKEKVEVIFQSGLTNLQVKQILETGNSNLPTLSESFEIHKPLFRILNNHYLQVTGKEIQNLPIT